MTSPRSSRPLTARALRCCFRLRRRSDPRGPRSLLQPHQPHRFLIIACRLWDRNVYSCIDGVHWLHRRFSDAGASVDKVDNPAVSSKCQKTPRIFHFIVPTFGFFSSAGDACLSAYREMPILNPAEREQEVFGPDTVAVLAVALEDTLRQLRLVDRNDPAVTIVAKTIIELARRGERDPVRLREQAIQSFR